VLLSSCTICMRPRMSSSTGFNPEAWRNHPSNERYCPDGPRYSKYRHPRRWHFSTSLGLRVLLRAQTHPLPEPVCIDVVWLGMVMMMGCVQPPGEGAELRPGACETLRWGTGQSTRGGESASHPKSKVVARAGPAPCYAKWFAEFELDSVASWFQSKR
jgi:hypothetical protein